MKKSNLLIMMVLILLGVVGCMQKDTPNEYGAEKQVLNQGEAIDEGENKNNDGIEGIASLIPDGWYVTEKSSGGLAVVEGDLNSDGIDDKAFVIEEKLDPEKNPQRDLIIAFGNEDASYSQSIRAEKAIMLRNDGGAFGDPFEDLIIDRGSIVLSFIGGSSERWYMNYRFRFQDEGWYLIGSTEGALVEVDKAMDNIEEDYNLITGDYVIRKLEDGKIVTMKGKVEKKPLIKLIDFDVYQQ